MKLRNKNTGEIIESACIGVFKHQSSGDCERVDTEARSLEKVLEVWEDYKPAEPLIKDERIRKIIRAWASENDSTSVVYYSPKNELADSYGNSISFNLIFRELNHGAEYTIAELCGEEEKPRPVIANGVEYDSYADYLKSRKEEK